MPGKSVPISVRLSNADAEFLANFHVAGATTLSEKMRALLASERKRKEGLTDYATCASLVEDLLAAPHAQLRRLHGEKDLHSIFALKLYDWLPELIAVMMTEVPMGDDVEVDLKRYERDLADHVFELIEDVMRLGLTRRSRTLDPELIQKRLPQVLELAELIQMKLDKEGSL